MTSWATVTTVRDRPEIVLAFVAHHLGAGAAEVWIYLDDPDDPVADLLAGQDGVRVVRCDAAHWARLGIARPPNHRVRQWRNANDALERTGAAWIGHIDIDEFVHADLAMADLLGALPAEVAVLRLRPVERIFTSLPAPGTVSFEPRFKRPLPHTAGLAQAIFGRHAAYLRRGFMGHLQGKCFARREGAGLRFRLHDVLGPDRAPVAAFETEVAILLHFYPFDYDAWVAKFQRRLDDAPFLAGLPPRDREKFLALAAARDQGGEAAARALFAELCLFDPPRLARLAAAGCLLELPLDLAGATSRRFGAAAVARVA